MNLQEQDVVKSSVGPLQVFSTAILTSLPHTQTQKPLCLPYTRLKHPAAHHLWRCAGGCRRRVSERRKVHDTFNDQPTRQGGSDMCTNKLPKFFHFGLKNYMEKQVRSDFSMKGKRSVAASQLLLIRLCRWS